MSRAGRLPALFFPLLVCAATLAAFWPALSHGFLRWDDAVYLLRNPGFRGFDAARLRWMLTANTMGLYHPLTWLSFAVDHALWGMDPRGYHLTNVLLHCANAVLFYLVCRRLLAAASRGAAGSWDSAAALAALLFAVHPLRAESVAWVTERKDVLSGFFCLLSVHAYLRAAAQPSRARLALSLAAFTLALLAKPLGLALPLVLLVLDVFPLRRLPPDPRAWGEPRLRAVLLEKLAFAAAALPIAALGWAFERRAGSFHGESLSAHAARAAFGLCYYAWKTLWPARLTPMVERPLWFGVLDWPFSACAAAVLAAGAALLRQRRRPALTAAALCYVLIAAPTLGIVAGPQLAADRYTYLACLPWAVLAAGAWELARRKAAPRERRAWAVAALGVVAALLVATRTQAGYWRDDETLWSHAVDARPQSCIARANLAAALADRDALAEAAAQYREAAAICPSAAKVQYAWAGVLLRQGDAAGAEERLAKALEISPDYAPARLALGQIRRRLTAR